MLKPVGAILLLGAVALLATHGLGEEGVRQVVRWTARAGRALAGRWGRSAVASGP